MFLLRPSRPSALLPATTGEALLCWWRHPYMLDTVLYTSRCTVIAEVAAATYTAFLFRTFQPLKPHSHGEMLQPPCAPAGVTSCLPPCCSARLSMSGPQAYIDLAFSEAVLLCFEHCWPQASPLKTRGTDGLYTWQAGGLRRLQTAGRCDHHSGFLF